MIFEKIKEVLVEKLDCGEDEITMETEFETLGMDSLDVTEVVMNMEDAFEVQIEIDGSVRTVADLVARIEALTAGEDA